MTAPLILNTSNILKEKKNPLKPLDEVDPTRINNTTKWYTWKHFTTNTPPWIIKNPKVILELNEVSKTKTHPSTYQKKFHNIRQLHPD